MEISLNWEGVNNDLDLHIFEPTGAYVFNGNTTGVNGALSTDIKRGGSNGETYLTKCSSSANITGNYTIAVNYYEGEHLVNGFFNIRVGNQTERV